MRNTTLILIRHGETTTNVKGVLHKFADTDKLTENGKQQIILTAKKLKDLGLEKLYVSNETRALESAVIIAEICKIRLTIGDDLEERNWGTYSGRPWSEIKEVLDPMSVNERYIYIPPGGESWESFENRLVKGIKSILKYNEGKIVGVVTHGGSIRALIPFLLTKPREESFKYDPKNASISVFNVKGDKITPISIDSTEHLQEKAK